jgi:hypothetical protein
LQNYVGENERKQRKARHYIPQCFVGGQKNTGETPEKASQKNQQNFFIKNRFYPSNKNNCRDNEQNSENIRIEEMIVYHIKVCSTGVAKILTDRRKREFFVGFSGSPTTEAVEKAAKQQSREQN